MIYSGYEQWKRWAGDAFGAFTPADELYFKHELSRSSVPVRPGLRVFEVGFGNGAFAGLMLSNQVSYVGSEINEVLVTRAKAKGVEVAVNGMRDFIPHASGTFDLVAAFDVLEHFELDEIRSFLSDAREVLRPGGVLLARMPSGDSPFGRAVFHGDVTHRTVLGSSAILQLAAQFRYDVVRIAPPALPVMGLGWRRACRRGMLTASQILVGRAINSIFHDGQPRVITSNLVFALRKPVNEQVDAAS